MKLYLALTMLLMSCLSASADERFLPYINWITENSELQYNGEPLPTIEVMPYKWLELEVYGPDNVARAEFNGTELPEVRGAYNHEENVMMFPEGRDVWEQEDVILHELVHFLQYVNGDVPDCIQQLERPAYELHWKWVEDHGREADFVEPNWLFVYMLEMACMEPPYSRYR